VRRRVFLLIALAVVAAWAFALVWSVTVTTHSPERLDKAAASAVAGACAGTQQALKQLPKPSPIAGADRVARIRSENAALRAMVDRFAAVEPRSSTPRRALTAWTADWRKVIDARERYASDLDTKHRAQFVLPAAKGVKPVTDKMDDFIRENHPDLDPCFTGALALETVEGPRDYKKVER
jgi:hypothetical protein